MAKADVIYAELLKDIRDNGVVKRDRTGTGTVSVFGRQIRFKMADGFPLLTTKKMFERGIIEELLWFLDGGTNIKELVEKRVNIWTGDAYKKYCDHFAGYEDIPSKEWFVDEIKNNTNFASKFGDLGPVYGKQWTDWGGFEIVSGEEIEGHNKGINQIQSALDLLINEPDSRRIMVNAWNVGELDKMTLPPCHYGFQLYTTEMSYEERLDLYLKSKTHYHPHYDDDTVDNIEGIRLGDDPERFFTNLMNEKDINFPTHKVSLMWNQRSVDTFLGLPFNIASYAFLLHMFAQQANMVPDELIGNLGDTHIYSNHMTQVTEQLSRGTNLEAPDFELKKAKDMFSYSYEDFKLSNYESYPSIKGELSN